ncbi:MAG: 23S rRNA (pseudouridine(1915)-N(3))-methyltransferase RlmH [Bdellovibrionaceae bacterium]|nr:23S rRNA (pseudouridine(1915)-N(3))-methyltransferase RlmH [Pseudobdellovibrionaceae bacterium]MDW8191182.1 23S rRNA (pseudouridine(1915)-N(3))-methyltransferase RlmH [Pseudobdellovibrionaceae bacterium]
MVRRYRFLSVKSAREDWVTSGYAEYVTKIKRWRNCEVTLIKTMKYGRDKALAKLELEGEAFLKVISDRDGVILFDQKGDTLDSAEFAQMLEKMENEGVYRELVWLVGGPFGVHPVIRRRAQKIISFGPMTFNHQLAFLMAFEQVYRALTIIYGFPYHNE